MAPIPVIYGLQASPGLTAMPPSPAVHEGQDCGQTSFTASTSSSLLASSPVQLFVSFLITLGLELSGRSGRGLHCLSVLRGG